jgi:PPM family protein phosphatase
MINVQSLALTDVGNQRENNEDRFLIDSSLGLYAVCDGMGGHAAGEIASEKAIEFAAEYVRARRSVLESASRSPDGYFHVVRLARDALRAASERVHRLAESDNRYAGMGTTMTMLLIAGDRGIMAHVGDSRLYLLRDTNVYLLSTDHTLANELVRIGIMSEEEAETNGFDHVLTRSVGQQRELDVESLVFDLRPNDTFLLCSDGLSQYFTSADEIGNVLRQVGFEEAPGEFVKLAKVRGGSDNITAVVLRAAFSGSCNCQDLLSPLAQPSPSMVADT